MIVVKVRDRDIKAAPMGPVTTGSVGLPVRWEFSEEWTGLAKTAVFRGSNTARDVFLTSDVCTVPAEVLTAGDGPLEIGVRGVQITHDEDTDEDVLTVVIPTIWGRIERIFDGTVPSQVDPSVQEPDWTDQVKAAAAEALSKATAVEQAAERGDFNGEDGASAYEQAVAGGYTGTEAQFNQELRSFKALSEQAADSAAAAAQSESNAAGSAEAAADSAEEAAEAAPFYAEYGVTTKAEIEAAINGKRQIYAYRNSGLLKPMLPYIGETRYGSTYPGDIGYRFALTEDAVQTIYSLTDQWTIQEINLNAPTQRAEAAQEAAEAAQAAAEAVLANIPADYTELTEDVAELTEDVAELTEDVDNLEQTTTATTIGPVALATFDASAADMPLKGLTVDIEPVQAGSGDPSPDNVRPITGWTGVKVFYPGLDIARDLDIVKNKYINASGVEVDATSDFSHTDYFPVAPGTTLYLSSYWDELPDSAPSIAFYDASKTFKTRQFLLPNENQYKGHIGYNFIARTVPSGSYFAILNFNYGVRDRVVLTDKDPTIIFPSEAGTVYGGTLDLVNNTLTVDRAVVDLGSLKWTGISSAGRRFFRAPISSMKNIAIRTMPIVCSNYLTIDDGRDFADCPDYCIYNMTPVAFAVIDPRYTASADFKAAVNGVLAVYNIANPVTYDITGISEVDTLIGTNNIWADCGDVTVTYGAYLETIKAYAEKVGDSILSAIAPLEMSYTASRAYAVGSFLFVGTKFYKVTAAIAEGGTITPDTNVIQTTVAEQLMSITLRISTEPQNKTVAVGETAAFTVAASGGRTPLSYQWYYRNPNTTGDNFSVSSNASATYSIKATTNHNNGFSVYCVVTDANGASVTSRTAELTLST